VASLRCEILPSIEEAFLVGSSSISEKCMMATPEIFGRVKDNLGRFKGEIFVRDIEKRK
jgi:hypothetical protein